jgi:hypothetical protein
MAMPTTLMEAMAAPIESQRTVSGPVSAWVGLVASIASPAQR